MKRQLFQLLQVSTLVLFGTFSAQASEQTKAERMVIVNTGDDSRHIETIDASELELGDAKTVFTEDGKTIDVLRTVDGLEIYINGKEVEIPDIPLDFAHMKHGMDIDFEHDIECISDDEEECDIHGLMVMTDDVIVNSDSMEDGKHIIRIHKELEGAAEGHSEQHEVIMIKRRITDDEI